MVCYNGSFLTNEQRSTLTAEQLKTCILLNDWSKDSGVGLFLMAPYDEKAPQGVRVNSSMYGFVDWARKKKATDGTLTEQQVVDEYERRMRMVNVRFSENCERIPLNHKHYVTLVATRTIEGTPENPVELIADYDHDEVDGLPDRVTRAAAFCDDPDPKDEPYDPSCWPVCFFVFFFFLKPL